MATRIFQASLKYRPLNTERAEIRLLEVFPAKAVDEPLHSRLLNVPLTGDLNYIGVSLLYGGATETEAIHVNGQLLTVPRSIGEALRHVRGIFTPGKVLDDLFSGPKGALGLERQSTTSTSNSSNGAQRTSTGAPVSATSSTTTTGSSTKTAESLKAPPRLGVYVDSNGWRKTTKWFKNAFRSVRSKQPRDAEQDHHRSTQPIRIWIDALCMNGRDAAEMGHRRSHTALAYREARMVVGWLGVRDEETSAAVQFLTTLADAAPPHFGDPKHRKKHPEHYGPIMEFLAPLEQMWQPGPGEKAENHPAYLALKSFLGRPYFCHNWILEELAFSKYPSFLAGDLFVSWLQLLRFVFICEEVVEKGSAYFNDDDRPLLNYLPLGSVYIFLEEYDRRRLAQAELEGTTEILTEDRSPRRPPDSAIYTVSQAASSTFSNI